MNIQGLNIFPLLYFDLLYFIWCYDICLHFSILLSPLLYFLFFIIHFFSKFSQFYKEFWLSTRIKTLCNVLRNKYNYFRWNLLILDINSLIGTRHSYLRHSDQTIHYVTSKWHMQIIATITSKYISNPHKNPIRSSRIYFCVRSWADNFKLQNPDRHSSSDHKYHALSTETVN